MNSLISSPRTVITSISQAKNAKLREANPLCKDTESVGEGSEM